ncbi:hypothetical protein RW25_07140 [Bacillus sp. L_1B0_8]|nr:hypothetical protein RT27_09985 [Bacillus sp. L_1B0_5]KIQ90872.1 hypothetical protein RW25_07140 [Bacillus sp. L_1B0_8]
MKPTWKLRFNCPNCEQENVLDLNNTSFSCNCGKEYTLISGTNRCVIQGNTKRTNWKMINKTNEHRNGQRGG